MDNSRRKLPSWMLGNNNNNNSDNDDDDNSNRNSNQIRKEDDNGKQIKARPPRSKANARRRKKDFYDDDDDDDVEVESSNLLVRCVERDKRWKRKLAEEGDEYIVDGDNETRMQTRKLGGNKQDGNGKNNLIDDNHDDYVDGDNAIQVEKRKNGAKGRGSKVRDNLVGSNYDDYVDGDDEIQVEKRKRGAKRWEGKGKSNLIGSTHRVAEEDDNRDANEIRMGMKKCGGTGQRGKKKSNVVVDVEGSLESTDCDEDLTVEDLMSIAEEYVNEDKEAGQQLSLLKDRNAEGLLSNAEQYAKKDRDLGEGHTIPKKIQDDALSGGSLCAGQYNKTFSKKEESGTHHVVNEYVASNETVMKPIMSGDPTQDMLHLFLGPLLKRPQDEEKKKKSDVIMQEISLAVQKQKQVAAPAEELVPLMKKKSSLKDKVAMFLD